MVSTRRLRRLLNRRMGFDKLNGRMGPAPLPRWLSSERSERVETHGPAAWFQHAQPTDGFRQAQPTDGAGARGFDKLNRRMGPAPVVSTRRLRRLLNRRTGFDTLNRRLGGVGPNRRLGGSVGAVDRRHDCFQRCGHDVGVQADSPEHGGVAVGVDHRALDIGRSDRVAP